MNTVADEVSKSIDYDDWTTTKSFFDQMNEAWGPFTVDRFASSRNTKTKRFNSLYWNPACEAVDAFTQDWSKDVNWVVPPVHLVSKALRHARSCVARGTLVAPYWESAAYWPLLRKNKYIFRKFVVATKVFHNTGGILELGDYKKSLSTRFRSSLIAVKFQF